MDGDFAARGRIMSDAELDRATRGISNAQRLLVLATQTWCCAGNPERVRNVADRMTCIAAGLVDAQADLLAWRARMSLATRGMSDAELDLAIRGTDVDLATCSMSGALHLHVLAIQIWSSADNPERVSKHADRMMDIAIDLVEDEADAAARRSARRRRRPRPKLSPAAIARCGRRAPG